MGQISFNEAYTAGADLLHVFEIAQRGDVNVSFAGGFQYRIVIRHTDFYAVYCKINFFHCRSSLISC